MAKLSIAYVCQSCGSIHPKWAGQCGGCGEWNTLLEEKQEAPLVKGAVVKGTRTDLVFSQLSAESVIPDRLGSGYKELDRVLGGGFVEGSVILVGGDPGIGKSTLLLQVAAVLSRSERVCYISGEEAIEQIRLRGKRLGLENDPLELLATTDLGDILTLLKKGKKPSLVIIDSIQTMYLQGIDSSPGSVSQVRACSHELIRFAKKYDVSVVLVGHVTKEGMIAGPRVLEHMVDTVLYFEGDRGHQFRIVRSVKNRFGATDEIGVFEMTQRGLREVSNPSLLFLPERETPVSGSVIYAGIEGTRPILVEIQALVSQSSFGTPRRAVIGWDPGRLSMILAVLETRCGVPFGARDVYLNVAGGIRIQEPAADLAVALALLSALTDTALPFYTVVCGEIGLSGEIRGISQLELRLKEAQKLGFQKALIPKRVSSQEGFEVEMDLEEMGHIREALSSFDFRQKREARHGSNL